MTAGSRKTTHSALTKKPAGTWKLTGRTVYAFEKQRRVWSDGTRDAVRMLDDDGKTFLLKVLPGMKGGGRKTVKQLPMTDVDNKILLKLNGLHITLSEEMSKGGQYWKCGVTSSAVQGAFKRSNLQVDRELVQGTSIQEIQRWLGLENVLLIALSSKTRAFSHELTYLLTKDHAHTLQAWTGRYPPQVWTLPINKFMYALNIIGSSKTTFAQPDVRSNYCALTGYDKHGKDVDQQLSVYTFKPLFTYTLARVLI